MKNQVVLTQVNTATSLVATGQFLAAEKALREIAQQEGDKALVNALKTVPPADLGQILINTATKPSALCADLVNPETFIKALLEVPKNWKPEGEELARLQLQELFYGVVMRPKDGTYGKDATKFLKAIQGNVAAVNLLAFYLQDFVAIDLADELNFSGSVQMPHGATVNVREDEEFDEEKMGDSTGNEINPNGRANWHACISEKNYEFNEGEWDHLAVIIMKNPSLLVELKLIWKKGIKFQALIPRVAVSKASKSAL